MPITEQDVIDQYQSHLRRAPTKAEIQDFQRFGSTGSVDLSAQDIGRILQSTPEYQQSQVTNYGQQIGGVLGSQDERILNIARAQVGQQFASQGRDLGSSGYLNAFAEAAANLALSRQQAMAGFYQQGFGNIIGNTQSMGQNTLNYGRGQLESSLNFGREKYWYNRQQDDFNNYLRGQQTRNLQGSLVNAGIGFGTRLLGGGMAGVGSYAGGGSFGGGFGNAFGAGMGGLKQ